jgi:hypothetical protein
MRSAGKITAWNNQVDGRKKATVYLHYWDIKKLPPEKFPGTEFLEEGYSDLNNIR